MHIHGLISDGEGSFEPRLLLPWDQWDKLFHRFGRTKVELIRSEEAVRKYCAKYVLKGAGDYNFYGHAYFWRQGVDIYGKLRGEVKDANDN